MDDLFEEGQMAKVYNRAYDIAFTEGAGLTERMQTGIRAVAEWARKQTLDAAADLVSELLADPAVYTNPAIIPVAKTLSAIRALGTPQTQEETGE